VERVPELARGDREVQPPEVGTAEEVQSAYGPRRDAGRKLAGDIEDRIRHLELSLPTRD
jgi:hypothetical protein